MEETMSKTLLNGVTAVSYTGGTSKTFEETPSAASGRTYTRTDGTSGLRETVRLVGRAPSYNSDGTVSSKLKATAVLVIPIQDGTTGEIRTASIRVEMLIDPRDHTTYLNELRFRAAQVCTETSFANLFNFGQE